MLVNRLGLTPPPPHWSVDFHGGPDLHWRFAQTSIKVRCPRSNQPSLAYLWHHLETWFWLVNAEECPQQYVPHKEIGITPQEWSLLHRHLRNLCLEKRCCETRCLDFVFDDGLRMVFVHDNFLRSDMNFPSNWPEMKGFHCPQREK